MAGVQPSLPPSARVALLDWYAPRARAYAWRRGRPSAYRTLVSELMLQQTQASRVEPAFRSFLRRFPSVSSLAAASRAEVLRAWAGLGYNRSAVVVAPGRTGGDDVSRRPGAGRSGSAAHVAGGRSVHGGGRGLDRGRCAGRRAGCERPADRGAGRVRRCAAGAVRGGRGGGPLAGPWRPRPVEPGADGPRARALPSRPAVRRLPAHPRVPMASGQPRRGTGGLRQPSAGPLRRVDARGPWPARRRVAGAPDRRSRRPESARPASPPLGSRRRSTVWSATASSSGPVARTGSRADVPRVDARSSRSVACGNYGNHSHSRRSGPSG